MGLRTRYVTAFIKVCVALEEQRTIAAELLGCTHDLLLGAPICERLQVPALLDQLILRKCTAPLPRIRCRRSAWCVLASCIPGGDGKQLAIWPCMLSKVKRTPSRSQSRK